MTTLKTIAFRLTIMVIVTAVCMYATLKEIVRVLIGKYVDEFDI